MENVEKPSNVAVRFLIKKTSFYWVFSYVYFELYRVVGSSRGMCRNMSKLTAFYWVSTQEYTALESQFVFLDERCRIFFR